MLNLTVRRLQVFVAIVEAGSFAAAARRLGIAQPSVSAHVQALERDVAGRLFERQSGRQAILTETGRGFLLHARALLDRTAKLEEEVGAQTRTAPPSVSVACQRSLAHTILRQPLADFARTRRDVRLSVRVAFQEEVMTAVRVGGVDVGCLLSHDEPEGAPSVLIGRQEVVIFAAPDHPLVGRQRVPPAELSHFDFVGAVPSSLFGRTQQKLLASLGVESVRIVAEATEFSLVRDLGAAGLGVCCSLRASVQPDIDAGRLSLIDLDAPPLTLDVRLVFNPQRRNARPVREFADYLRASMAPAD